MCDCVLCL
uniref:Uncharacterized protein n=1 Tax=Rhizophora mucronata TaxID=61149 RepID=A0A2P2PLE0_RHIMU